MMYDIQELLGFWTLSIVRNSKLFLRDPTEYASFALHLRTETDPVSETLCFLVCRIPDDVKSLEILILSLSSIYFVSPLVHGS
jgi:hypothetical protein